MVSHRWCSAWGGRPSVYLSVETVYPTARLGRPGAPVSTVSEPCTLHDLVDKSMH